MADFLNLRVKFELIAHRFKAATTTLHQLEYTLTVKPIPNSKLEEKSSSATTLDCSDEYDQNKSKKMQENTGNDEDCLKIDTDEIPEISFKPAYIDHGSCSCDPCCDVYLQSIILKYYYAKVDFACKKLKKLEVYSYLKPLPMIFHSLTTRGFESIKSVLCKADKYKNIKFQSSISTLMYHESLIKLNMLHLKTSWLFDNDKKFQSYIARTEKLVKLQKYTFLLCNEYEEEALYYKAIAVFPELNPLRVETLEKNIIKEENFKRLLSPTLNRLRSNRLSKKSVTPKSTKIVKTEKVTSNMKREIKEEMTFNVDLDNDDFVPSPILGFREKQNERKRRRVEGPKKVGFFLF